MYGKKKPWMFLVSETTWCQKSQYQKTPEKSLKKRITWPPSPCPPCPALPWPNFSQLWWIWTSSKELLSFLSTHQLTVTFTKEGASLSVSLLCVCVCDLCVLSWMNEEILALFIHSCKYFTPLLSKKIWTLSQLLLYVLGSSYEYRYKYRYYEYHRNVLWKRWLSTNEYSRSRVGIGFLGFTKYCQYFSNLKI